MDKVKDLMDKGLHNKASYKLAEYFGLKYKILGYEYKVHFANETKQRYVFKIQLKRNGKQYTFEFGQSISEGGSEPTLYSVLTCLQKYDVGSYGDFCSNFGHDYESETSKKIYRAVLKEYNNMLRLFTAEELETINELINL